MQTWTIDSSHSSVHFTVRHLVFAKVHGAFKTFSGELGFDEKSGDFAKVNATIDAASVDTGEEKRDAHLRSADFFEAEKFKTLTFASTKIEKDGEGYKLHGDLTIHGQTKPVVLAVEALGRAKDPWGNTRAAFSATVSINRKDFGLVWNQVLDAGGLAVSDKVDITLDIQAIAKQPEVSKAAVAQA